MGARTHYLGHVDISPPLNQAEYDHLRAVARGEARLVEPDELEPWHPWAPCPHGCCLQWDGSDSHGPGADGLQLLIDHFLSPGGPADARDSSVLTGFTFDHDTNGVVVGEDDDRGLFLVRVDHGQVRTEMLLRGDPSPWEPGPRAKKELPWLSPELRPSERYRLENAATLAKPPERVELAGG